jgi:hypothetical protein
MKDFMQLTGEYAHYWIPLLVGMAAGVLAIATGNVLVRRRRPPAEGQTSRPHPNPDYDPFTQGSPAEQRKAYRRNGNPVEIFYKFPDDKSNRARHGVALDRSVGGMRLGLDAEVAPGARLLVLPANASDMVPWTEVEVRTCRAISDSWEVGCQFVKVPPWSVLLLFG